MSTCPSRAVDAAASWGAAGAGACFLPQAATAQAMPDSRSTREIEALVDRIKELPLKDVLEGLFSRTSRRGSVTPPASSFHEGSFRLRRGRTFPQLLRTAHTPTIAPP